MKLTAEFDLDQRYEDPDSAEFQGLMREMETELLAVLRDESNVSIIGVQIKAIDSEGTLEVFVETESSEDAGSLVQETDGKWFLMVCTQLHLFLEHYLTTLLQMK